MCGMNPFHKEVGNRTSLKDDRSEKFADSDVLAMYRRDVNRCSDELSTMRVVIMVG